MENKSMIIAAMYSLATLVFVFQSFDQFGGGNPIAGVVNVVGAVFVGRISWDRIQKLRGVRI